MTVTLSQMDRPNMVLQQMGILISASEALSRHGRSYAAAINGMIRYCVNIATYHMFVSPEGQRWKSKRKSTNMNTLYVISYYLSLCSSSSNKVDGKASGNQHDGV
jgi:hypothetical protein